MRNTDPHQRKNPSHTRNGPPPHSVLEPASVQSHLTSRQSHHIPPPRPTPNHRTHRQCRRRHPPTHPMARAPPQSWHRTFLLHLQVNHRRRHVSRRYRPASSMNRPPPAAAEDTTADRQQNSGPNPAPRAAPSASPPVLPRRCRPPDPSQSRAPPKQHRGYLPHFPRAVDTIPHRPNPPTPPEPPHPS